MADFKGIGKLVLPLAGAISVTIWIQILMLRQRGESPVPARPHEPNSWPRGAGPRAFAAAFFLPWLIQLVAIYLLPGSGMNPTNRLVALLWLGTLTQIGAVVLLLYVEIAAPLKTVDFGLAIPIRWREDMVVGALGFVASLLPVYAVNLVVHLLGWHPPETQHKLLEILQGNHSGITVAGAVIAATCLAPLAEELLYRVVLQGGLERQISPTAALWLTAALFAGVHSLSGRPDALPLFPLALILGYTYLQTHSYVAVVTLHALFNTFSVVMALSGRAL